jgi:uncharacterized membrane protein YhfC
MGILVAAAIATLAVAAFSGYLATRLSQPADRPVLLLAAIVALPLQPLAFHFVRIPLDGLVRAALSTDLVYAIATTSYAPLTEEPAKWLVLLLPAVRRVLRPDNAIAVALAIGLGFGLGEIWFLANQVAQVPAYGDLPFWMFGGFLGERFVVTFLHGGFIAFLVARLAAGRALLPGALAGMALHYLVNLPIFLRAVGALGLSTEAWTVIAGLTPVVVAILIGVALNRISRGRFQLEALGRSTCPECGTVYPRPLLAANLGPWRYERCPNCRRFHMVKLYGQPKPVGDKSGKA